MQRASVLAGVLIAALYAGSAQAQMQGADALGGFESDAPGVTRFLTPDDLPEPGTDVRSNSSRVIEQPDGAMPNVPAGFSIEKVATGLRQPRSMETAPNGDLFVSDSAAGVVRVLHVGDDGAAEITDFATGLNRPYGLAFYPPKGAPEWLYVATTGGLVRFPYDGRTKAAGEGEVLFENMPRNGHWTRSIAFSPDGKTLYYSVGSGSNVAEGMRGDPDGPLGAPSGLEAKRAMVWAMDPDGNNRRIFATGLRNCSGMDIQPGTGALWCAVNERDGLGNDLPFDYATHVEDGAFYGWPWYYIGDHEDPRHAGVRPDLADKVSVPDVLIQAHSAPLGIGFYEGDAFGAGYDGDAFIALHGSWNRDPRTGYKVIRALFEDGAPTGAYEDFVTGFVREDGAVWGRPVGVTMGKDGALYFSEDGNGTIWRVRRE